MLRCHNGKVLPIYKNSVWLNSIDSFTMGMERKINSSPYQCFYIIVEEEGLYVEFSRTRNFPLGQILGFSACFSKFFASINYAATTRSVAESCFSQKGVMISSFQIAKCVKPVESHVISHRFKSAGLYTFLHKIYLVFSIFSEFDRILKYQNFKSFFYKSEFVFFRQDLEKNVFKHGYGENPQGVTTIYRSNLICFVFIFITKRSRCGSRCLFCACVCITSSFET